MGPKIDYVAIETYNLYNGEPMTLVMAEALVGSYLKADQECKELEDYAFGIGLVFQIVDDVLDVTSTAEQLGKPIGSDSENGKTTFVTLYGAEGAMELAKKLNNETCASLHAEFGEKAAFLEQLAKELLVRRS